VIRAVLLSATAEKDLKACPQQVVRKFVAWVSSVQLVGLETVRKQPGWHDEALRGRWSGYRSIRLNIAYRAIYRITSDDTLELALVETVNKHKY
jgi:toxin HigB-1